MTLENKKNSVNRSRVLIATGIYPPDIGGPATYLPQFISFLESKDYNVKVVTFSDISNNDSKNKKCDWPWRSLYVTCDGYLTPCCMQGSDPELINFGNMFKSPIKDILNNEKYQQFRNKLRSKKLIPLVCVNCPAYFRQKVLKI